MHEMVNFHCHGTNELDFSSDLVGEHWLTTLTSLLEKPLEENVQLVPTIFMRRRCFENLELMCDEFSARYDNSIVKPVLGFGIEGPVIASRGGTPRSSQWKPTLKEWSRIASLGHKGLSYCVISFEDGYDLSEAEEIYTMLAEGGVNIAPGHFTNASIENIEQQLDLAIGVLEKYGRQLLSDHLFNDMPLNFKHAWRANDSRKSRPGKILDFRERIAREGYNGLPGILGRIPARLVEYNRMGKATLCINFDGSHVDLGVLAALKDVISPSGIIAMTDQICMPKLCDEVLKFNNQDYLYYDKDGVVSAGSSSMEIQKVNLLMLGYTPSEIELMTYTNCMQFLDEPTSPAASEENSSMKVYS